MYLVATSLDVLRFVLVESAAHVWISHGYWKRINNSITTSLQVLLSGMQVTAAIPKAKYQQLLMAPHSKLNHHSEADLKHIDLNKQHFEHDT